MKIPFKIFLPILISILAVSCSSGSETNSIAVRSINDTGITACGDYAFVDSVVTHNNNIDCAFVGSTINNSGTDSNGNTVPLGQDAVYGRDSNGSANSNLDGHAGFSFKKISNGGVILPSNEPNWECIQDKVTGLVWENKKSGGLHNSSNTYKWFDTVDYVADVNAAKLCGASDWRLPSIDELRGIRTLDRIDPVVDKNYFEFTESGDYWSSSPYALNPQQAWVISFFTGEEKPALKSAAKYVRLVRG